MNAGKQKYQRSKIRLVSFSKKKKAFQHESVQSLN